MKSNVSKKHEFEDQDESMSQAIEASKVHEDKYAEKKWKGIRPIHLAIFLIGTLVEAVKPDGRGV